MTYLNLVKLSMDILKAVMQNNYYNLDQGEINNSPTLERIMLVHFQQEKKPPGKHYHLEPARTVLVQG